MARKPMAEGALNHKINLRISDLEAEALDAWMVKEGIETRTEGIRVLISHCIKAGFLTGKSLLLDETGRSEHSQIDTVSSQNETFEQRSICEHRSTVQKPPIGTLNVMNVQSPPTGSTSGNDSVPVGAWAKIGTCVHDLYPFPLKGKGEYIPVPHIFLSSYCAKCAAPRPPDRGDEAALATGGNIAGGPAALTAGEPNESADLHGSASDVHATEPTDSGLTTEQALVQFGSSDLALLKRWQADPSERERYRREHMPPPRPLPPFTTLPELPPAVPEPRIEDLPVSEQVRIRLAARASSEAIAAERRALGDDYNRVRIERMMRGIPWPSAECEALGRELSAEIARRKMHRDEASLLHLSGVSMEAGAERFAPRIRAILSLGDSWTGWDVDPWDAVELAMVERADSTETV